MWCGVGGQVVNSRQESCGFESCLHLSFSAAVLKFVHLNPNKETLVVLQGLALLWGQQKQNTPLDSSRLPGELRLEFGFTYQIPTRIFF